MQYRWHEPDLLKMLNGPGGLVIKFFAVIIGCPTFAGVIAVAVVHRIVPAGVSIPLVGTLAPIEVFFGGAGVFLLLEVLALTRRRRGRKRKKDSESTEFPVRPNF